MDWQENFGYTQSRDVNLSDSADLVNTSRYIAKYCNKLDMENPDASTKVLPTFHLISKGLGLDKLQEIKDYILKSKDLEEMLKRSKICINGFYYNLPKYYKDKIFGTKSLLRVRLADYLAKRNDKLYLEQLSQLQSENPNDSAFRIYDVQTAHDNTSKAEKLRERQLRFYNKSQI